MAKEIKEIIIGVKAFFCPLASRYPAIIVAPIAPIEPAWLTVAIPKRIDPKTAKIKARGGIIINKILNQNAESNFPSYGTGGAALGLNLA